MELAKRKSTKSKSQRRGQKRTQQMLPAGASNGFGNQMVTVPKFTKSIFPPRMRALLPLTIDFTLLASGNTAALFAYSVSVNNPYLPFNTAKTFANASLGAGGSVAGFTAIPSAITPANLAIPALNFLYGSSSQPYQRVKVNRLKYSVTMQPQGSLDVGQLIVCPLNTLAQFNSSDPSSLSTYPLSKSITCAPNSSADRNTIRGTVDCAQLQDFTALQWSADYSNFVCANGAAPVNNQILEIMWVDGTSSVLSNNLVHKVTLEWDVEFFGINNADLIE
jgi:hypothetical protein